MNEAAPAIADEELARQTQTGSLVAFETLVARYENRIFGFILQSCRHPTDARELTQDTFVKAFQSIGTFDARLSFRTWLFTIARRKCIDHFRAPQLASHEPAPEQVGIRTPADDLVRQEEADGLWAYARRTLPGLQFQALWLHYAEDMAIDEISKVLRKTRTHVKVLLFRARQALARELQHAAGATSVRSSTAPAFLFNDNEGIV